MSSAGRRRGSLGLVCWRCEAVLRRRAALPASLSVGELNRAKVGELAVGICACCAVIAEAKRFISTFELQVFRGLRDC